MKNILRFVVVILFYRLVFVVSASAQFINDMTDYQLKQAARQFYVSDLRVGKSAWVRPLYCVKGNRIYMRPDTWLLPKEVATLNIRLRSKDYLKIKFPSPFINPNIISTVLYPPSAQKGQELKIFMKIIPFSIFINVPNEVIWL